LLLAITWINYRKKREVFASQAIPNENSIQTTEDALQYGDSIHLIEIEDITGAKILSENNKGKIRVFQFFQPEMEHHKDALVYADIIAKQYNGENFIFIAVGEGRLDWLLRRGFQLKHFRTVADEDFLLHKLFKINYSGGATIIIDDFGVVRFISKGLVPNDIFRQLIIKLAQSSS
jgi:hypothetical protein